MNNHRSDETLSTTKFNTQRSFEKVTVKINNTLPDRVIFETIGRLISLFGRFAVNDMSRTVCRCSLLFLTTRLAVLYMRVHGSVTCLRILQRQRHIKNTRRNDRGQVASLWCNFSSYHMHMVSSVHSS